MEGVGADFKSNYISIEGSNLQYVDEGQGDPILFLHGIPASSYSWRHIIPSLMPMARCIAPDMIGMGKSDKPKIEYRIFDHIRYIEGFIKALNLKRITLVLHGWGSVVGFHFAMQHPELIKGLAFYEAHVKPAEHWEDLSLPIQQLATLLQNEKASYRAVMQDNYVLKKLLPRAAINHLSKEVTEQYEQPFLTIESRLPLWQYLKDLPLGNNEPRDVIALINDYSKKLQQSNLPKLLLYAIPGFTMSMTDVIWCRQHLPNLTVADLGEALHFAQETQSEQFANALTSWYKKL